MGWGGTGGGERLGGEGEGEGTKVGEGQGREGDKGGWVGHTGQ